MQTKSGVTETELRVLRSLHLRGFMGPMGSMKINERGKLLDGLIDKGLLTKECNLTRQGIEACLISNKAN